MVDEAIDYLTLDGADAGLVPAPETPAVETPVPVEQAAPAAPNPGPDPASPAAPAVQPGFVPLSAVLDEREKRQGLEKQLQELQRKQQPPAAMPDATSDPKGWQAAQDARYQKYEMDTKMQMSGRFAAQHYGQDKVQAAMQWGQSQNAEDQYFGSKFTAQSDPYGWLVEQHRQAQALGLLAGKSPEDWALAYAQSQGFVKPEGAAATPQQPATAPAVAQPVAPQRPAAPPRSIANETPAGGTAAVVTLTEPELLGDIFSR